MKILIETIPHSKQRYPTCGDWKIEPDGTVHILVSQEVGEDSAFAIAVHELLEQNLCAQSGITQKSVDDFDIAFEKNRKPGDDSEPGDDPLAPYKKEHFFATSIERLVVAEKGMDWFDHDDRILSLP
jgi:hypothetical protein